MCSTFPPHFPSVLLKIRVDAQVLLDSLVLVDHQAIAHRKAALLPMDKVLGKVSLRKGSLVPSQVNIRLSKGELAPNQIGAGEEPLKKDLRGNLHSRIQNRRQALHRIQAQEDDQILKNSHRRIPRIWAKAEKGTPVQASRHQWLRDNVIVVGTVNKKRLRETSPTQQSGAVDITLIGHRDLRTHQPPTHLMVRTGTMTVLIILPKELGRSD